LNQTLQKEGEQLKEYQVEIKNLQSQSRAILDIEDIEAYALQIETAYQSTQKRYNELSNEVVSIKATEDSCSKQISELIHKQKDDEKELQRVQSEFENVLIENDFASQEAYQNALFSQEERELLEKNCKALEEQYTQIETLKNTTLKQLQEQKALELNDKPFDEVEKELQELSTNIDELQKSIGSLEKELEINATNIAKHATKIEALQSKREAFKVWIKLNDMIGSSSGDKFAKFAQGITLDQLIYLANGHLTILSPRYELQRSTNSQKLLELEIIDGFQGDAVRPVSTLSGGESFIVSLALALGLSALASQKIAIDSLFLDEGFGTLDNNSLEMALNALNALQSSGKMVGVISHVEALKERIPKQIKIVPNGDGTSKVELK
jgi:exonuclease SbcC